MTISFLFSIKIGIFILIIAQYTLVLIYFFNNVIPVRVTAAESLPHLLECAKTKGYNLSLKF